MADAPEGGSPVGRAGAWMTVSRDSTAVTSAGKVAALGAAARTAVAPTVAAAAAAGLTAIGCAAGAGPTGIGCPAGTGPIGVAAAGAR